jgi:N-sulfoglucosamine sulfohydrolase
MFSRTAQNAWILAVWSCHALVFGSSHSLLHAAKQPNIVWLVGENVGHDLGCYGASNVHTPNLDRLALDGTRFTQVFSTNPACAPSRSAFMLGMYQTTTDTHHMRSHRDDGFRLPNGVRPLTHRLQDVGYHTSNIKAIGNKAVGTGKLDLNFVNEGPIYQGDSWDLLKEQQPFFVQINSHEVEYDIYDRKSASKARVPWVGENEHVQHAQPDHVTPPPYYPNHPLVRQEWARYLNSVSGMDLRIGWVLDQLRRDGLEDNTIVVFFADNGRLEPRGIHWCYDSGLRVPMIIRWPKEFPAPEGFGPGVVNNQLISLIDLTATTLQFAGVAPVPEMQGRSFLEKSPATSRQFVFAARDRIDETYHRIRSVHDGRYHYIRTFSTGPIFSSLNRYKEKCFPIMPLMRALYARAELQPPGLELFERRGPCEELYHLESDPWEINDLIRSEGPEHRTALARLQKALEDWIVETRDRGSFVEPPEISDAIEKEMDIWFGTPEWAKK